MITCAEAVRQMWEYVEREIDPVAAERVEEHLDLCLRCCGEMEFAEQLREFMARGSEVDVPAALMEKFEKLLDDLEAEGV